MVTIRKRKLTSTTLYSVTYINGIPTFSVHKNCKISTETRKDYDFKYLVEITDDKQRVLSSHECDTLSCLDEIKVRYLFYDEKEAIKCYKESVAEKEQDLKEQIKTASKKLKLLKKTIIS